MSLKGVLQTEHGQFHSSVFTEKLTHAEQWVTLCIQVYVKELCNP